ncbi:MAG: sigma-70 family RNA polymerase sigma factor [Planctomycetales bacterium]|nr:sigma-70 family RNA polymerase sigma factor [Planctomycetales bacterium]
MSSVDSKIQKAKAGDGQALDLLLARYRNYLAVLVSMSNRGGKRLQSRFDASDVVQNTMLDAFKDFAEFQGNTEPELLAWLRKVLAYNLADLVREHHAEKRDVKRQVEWVESLSQSSQRLQRLVPHNRDQPRHYYSRQEVVVMLADALAKLPDDYRLVIVMRHLHKASFNEIGDHMGRSAGAVRMLWARAVGSLRVINAE